MKEKLLFILLFTLSTFIYSQEITHKFNTQIIFEVDGKPVSKKMFYESSFKIVDEKTIIWIYYSPVYNDMRYTKYFIQKKFQQNQDGVDVILYNVIDDKGLNESVILKGSGIINGVQREMFEVWMNMEASVKTNADYNFKMRFVNE